MLEIVHNLGYYHQIFIKVYILCINKFRPAIRAIILVAYPAFHIFIEIYLRQYTGYDDNMTRGGAVCWSVLTSTVELRVTKLFILVQLKI